MSETTTNYTVWLADGWTGGESGIEVSDPATGEVFARVPSLPRARVDQAIDDAEARRADWAARTVAERAGILAEAARLVTERTETIAAAITRENGKPLQQSRGEVAMTADHFRWFAEEGRRAYGRIVPNQAPGKRHLIMKHPIGVVGAISPWNFPLVLAVRKVAPALAAGCPVVLKPASATPVCAVHLAECLEAAGVPPGVFQLVTGKSSEIGEAMLAHPACKKISFTGSTEVGRKLAARAGETLTKVSLELGGNAPLLVFADADLERAVDEAMKAKFRNIGQSCIAANRILVERSVCDAFLEKFRAKVEALKMGPGTEDGVEIGPLIDGEAADSAEAFVRSAADAGARVLCGGERGEGNFFPATLLADVPDEAPCMGEEVFAPIAPVSPFDTEEEAIRRANDTEYGLSAYAFTRDLDRALRLAEQLEAGSVGINDGVPTMSCCPFGGFKASGSGRELGSEGLDAYLETKHVSILTE